MVFGQVVEAAGVEFSHDQGAVFTFEGGEWQCPAVTASCWEGVEAGCVFHIHELYPATVAAAGYVQTARVYVLAAGGALHGGFLWCLALLGKLWVLGSTSRRIWRTRSRESPSWRAASAMERHFMAILTTSARRVISVGLKMLMA